MRSGEGSLSSFGVSRSDMSDCFVGPRYTLINETRESKPPHLDMAEILTRARF